MTHGTPVVVEIEDGSRHEFVMEARESGRSLADLLAAHGFPLNTRCGQRGLCRGCEVTLRPANSGADADSVKVHACETRLPANGSPVTVGIPSRSRIEHRPQVTDTFRIDIPCAHQPLFEGTVAQDTAFAVDVGTTTVAVMVIDIASGEVLGRAGGFNEQIRFGDNVLTRIDAVRSPGALVAMQKAVAGTIGPLLSRACERAARSPARLAGGAISGNTTMLHLLAGEDPSPLGVAPFTPRFIEGKRLSVTDIGSFPGVESIAPDLPLQLLPGIAAYVGADITAGMWASGMVFDSQPSLLVDIGTNGEIVLQHEGRLVACATAAGPAFEGAGLRCGTRARERAVSGIEIDGDPFAIHAETIGQVSLARADGICGSAYVDFLSAGRSTGLLLHSGRFCREAWKRVPLSHRIETAEGELALKIAGANGEACISEQDIAVLLQAKAAIAAGIETLLETTGITAPEIARVYLAGGFGMHLKVGHAIAAGLLPGFQEEQIRVVGNTALAGALLVLLDRDILAEMEALRSRVEIVELNLHDSFEDRFIDHLSLP